MDLQGAVQRWTHQLADVSGRNPLLAFNPDRKNSLPLLGGRASGVRESAVLALLRGDLIRSTELTAGDNTDLDARCRLIGRQAQASFEERGVRTLFVAHGIASWQAAPGKPRVSAPVLLQSATLTPIGSGGSWELGVSGDSWEVNPLLVQILEAEHGVRINDLASTSVEEPSFFEACDTFFDAIRSRCVALPEFSIEAGSYLANFSYEKLALVNDIKDAFNSGVMADNDVLLALAGDIDAAVRLRGNTGQGTYTLPDLVAPSDEYLVVDADSSQTAAIGAVVGGANLVIEGPPGTGKSQTIANLIATLAARGKKVLFVAEKRAAIEAVTRRLNSVGLGDIVLDLHDGAQSRRHIYRQIEETLTNNSRVVRPDTQSNDMSLLQRRQALIDYTTALHEERDPWGVSVFSCQDALTGSTVNSPIRFRSETLFMLNADNVRRVRERLRRFATLGGIQMEGVSADPWQNVYQSETIADGETAAAALEAIHDFRYGKLGGLLARLRAAATDTGLPASSTLQGWRTHFAIWERTRRSLEHCREEIFTQSPDTLADLLDTYRRPPAGRLLASLTSDTYRRARDTLTGYLHVGSQLDRDSVCDTIEEVILLLRDWGLMANGKTLPCLPGVPLDELDGEFRALMREVRDLERWLGDDQWGVTPTGTLLALLDRLIAQSSTLYRIPELVKLRRELHTYGLREFVDEAAGQRLTDEQTVELFDTVWYASILDRVSFADPTIGTFSGDDHRRLVDNFREVDRAHIRFGAAKVRRLVAERAHLMFEAHPREGNLIRQQARLKRGHMPLRKFFARTAELAAAIKPCWATSPLMVSQMLPQRVMFDVVIFDEASQIPPAEAVSAILRSRQVVVAGDSKQLPPTSFFASKVSPAHGSGSAPFWTDSFSDADDTESPHDAMVLESILDAMAATFPNSVTTLSWHYRSRDEKLILFSNAQPNLYDWSLVTFPGARTAPCLEHVLADPPVQHSDGTVDTPEADRVVAMIADHAASRPHESLGVIAFGVRHAELIQEALFAAQQTDPVLAEWLAAGVPAKNGEPLFVKNLERVQGDERDRIILSVGYGKRPDGKMVYRFGPINMDGGERRLNVAVTRARRHMAVVSTFTAAEMDEGRLRSDGAKMLQRYISYAESQGTDLGALTYTKPNLSVFERDVLRHLIAEGLPVTAHYGASGQWLSFAVAHPTDPSRMVLAVECDDARYRAIATVRDRDRLRQEHLERLGWSFYRLWSTDWQRDPQKEAERIAAAWRAATLKADHENDRVVDAEPFDVPVAGSAGQLPPKRLPFPLRHFAPGTPISKYTPMELVELMRWIESDGLLRTENDLINEAMLVLGFRRRGPNIIKALHDAARTARYRIPI